MSLEGNWSDLYLRRKDWESVQESLDWGRVMSPGDIEAHPLLNSLAFRFAGCIDFARSFYRLEDYDPDIVFCIIDSAAFNAAAHRQGGVYCIAISMGLFEGLIGLCTHFSDTESVLELFELPLTDFSIKVSEPIKISGPNLLSKSRTPHGDADVSLTLLFSALDFAIFHEATHLLHGHHAIEMRPGMFCEALSFGLSQDEALTSQALEYDADSTGIRNALVYGLEFERTAFKPEMAATPTRRMQLTVLGAYLFMKALQIVGDQGDRALCTHPPASERLTFCAAAAATFAEQANIATFDEFISGPMAKVVLAAELGFIVLTSDVSTNPYTQAASDDYLKRLNGRWARLYPMAIREKLGPIPLSAPIAEPI